MKLPEGDAIAAAFFRYIEQPVGFGNHLFDLRNFFALLGAEPERNRHRDNGILPREAVLLDGGAQAFCTLAGIFGPDAREQQ